MNSGAKQIKSGPVTVARSQQVSLQDTPYYHCISRCVRRAYLCGDDPLSGRNLDHRKQWLVTRFKFLAAHFAIDICAYAVMSNHYHLVLHVDKDRSEQWRDDEVVRRWTVLFPANGAMLKTLRKNNKTRVAQRQYQRTVNLWRERLRDISWFMRCLNENIARMANREDECTGRFWEGRFKSQALLDEKALLTCMAYVDLNPVRAGITESLETSDFTSIQERLIEHAKKVKTRTYRQHRLLTRRASQHLVGHRSPGQAQLKPLAGMMAAKGKGHELPITQQAYFELLESTCKAICSDEIEPDRRQQSVVEKSNLLQDFSIGPYAWLSGVLAFHRYYATAAGTETSLLHFHRSRIKAGVDYKHLHKWIRGTNSARLLYGT
ncbi:MAG: hypothetical protein MI755_20630 [Sphingomonadales bacterium]|nr:hypothetical protein [Sphingomonadales bacterium]